MTKQRGFTLMELIITIAVLGILGAIAVLNAPAILNTYRVKGAARQLYSDMQMARLTAIKGGRAWCVIFNGSPFTSYIVVDSGDGTCDAGDTVDAIGEKTVAIASEYPGVTMTHNFSGNTLNFNPNGTAEGGAATLCNSSRGQQVVVNPNTGNIRIDNGNPC